MPSTENLVKEFSKSDSIGIRVYGSKSPLGQMNTYRSFRRTIASLKLANDVRVVLHDSEIYLVKVPEAEKLRGFRLAASKKPYAENRRDKRLERILVRRYNVPQTLVDNYRDQFDTDDYDY